MGKIQRAWAVRAREKLIQQLGGKCDLCGSRHELHIDHPWGRDWTPRTLDMSRRVSRYRKEALEGLVRVLCAKCNESPKNRPKPRPSLEAVAAKEKPF